MYIFKNSFRNITRNKGRNILIGIILVVIGASCSVALAIRQSANNIVKSYEEENKIEATIAMDRKSLMNTFKDGDKSQEEMIESFNNIDSITIEEIEKYGNSNYVTNYYYSYDLSVNAKDISEATDSLVKETTTTKTTTSTRSFSGAPSGFPGGGPGGYPGGGSSTTSRTTTKKTEKIYNEKASNGAFNLVGYDSYSAMSDFVSGNYVVTDGSVFTDFSRNDVLISEELATLNSLSVGDKITFKDPKKESLTYEATIVGIYKENTDSSNDMKNMFSNSANKIITTNSFIKTILDGNSDLTATITPTFIIKDKTSVSKFTSEVEEKGLGEYFTVSSNLEEIENATKSVENVKVFATTFLIITLAIGAIVLIVINMINIRERKYEIGVLRTIGMKKGKLSLQFMSELVMVGIISLLIGTAVGSFASVPISNKLLESEIKNASSKYEDIGNNFGMKEGIPGPGGEDFRNNGFGVANVQAVDSINAAVDVEVVGKLLGIGIILILISSLVSMVAIARFSPLTILKERS